MASDRVHRRGGISPFVTRHIRAAGTALPIVILGAMWELASGTIISARLLPPMAEILTVFVDLWVSMEVPGHILATLFRGVMGILLAASIGVSIGLIMSRSDTVYEFLDPVISLTYPLPKSALIPLLLVWVGSGHTPRILLATIGAILPIVISTLNGANGVKRELIWAGESMGLEENQVVRKVIFPATLPSIMSGIRIGLIFSFIIVIASEMLIAQIGLGMLVSRFGDFGNYAGVFAVLFNIVIFVASLDRLYLAFSGRVLAWSEEDISEI